MLAPIFGAIGAAIAEASEFVIARSAIPRNVSNLAALEAAVLLSILCLFLLQEALEWVGLGAVDNNRVVL